MMMKSVCLIFILLAAKLSSSIKCYTFFKITSDIEITNCSNETEALPRCKVEAIQKPDGLESVFAGCSFNCTAGPFHAFGEARSVLCCKSELCLNSSDVFSNGMRPKFPNGTTFPNETSLNRQQLDLSSSSPTSPSLGPTIATSAASTSASPTTTTPSRYGSFIAFTKIFDRPEVSAPIIVSELLLLTCFSTSTIFIYRKIKRMREERKRIMLKLNQRPKSAQPHNSPQECTQNTPL